MTFVPALLSMFEEKGARPNVPYVGKGGKPGNRTHYQEEYEEYDFQGNEYDDTQGESPMLSHPGITWQDEWQDQSAWRSSDMGNTGQAWSEHDKTIWAIWCATRRRSICLAARSRRISRWQKDCGKRHKHKKLLIVWDMLHHENHENFK